MPTLLQRLTGRGETPPSPSSSRPVDAAATSVPLTERDKLVAEAKAWGYFAGAIKTRRDLWAGRRILDIGMGGGPHAVSFIEGGAASYVGVDPHVGTDRVRDFRNIKDPAIPAYHAFTYSTDEIMRLLPNVHLYKGYLEHVADDVKANNVDMAMMAAVTEHLHRPHDVMRSIWEILQPGGHLWICHCNYYSWTGHHRAPRSVALWDRADKEQSKHVDWQHLEPTHPDYSNDNFNRVRLQDLRAVIETYFDIVEWNVSVEGLERLTPQLRRKWRRYTLDELLGQNIYITAKRRDVPFVRDLSRLELHHPSEAYLATADHASEDIAPYTLAHSVYFTQSGALCSHSDNDHAGLRVFARLEPGDIITVQKFTVAMRLTVAQLVRAEKGGLRLTFDEPIPETVLNGNHDQWTITDFGPKLSGTAIVPAPDSAAVPPRATPALAKATPAEAATKIAVVTPEPARQPLPGLDLMTATLNAIDGYAQDMADVRYLITLAKAIGAEPYEALQHRHAATIARATSEAGPEKYLDVPYWVGHKLGLAKTLGLLDGRKMSLLDLGTGAGHLLRVAGDHGHHAVGIDVDVPLYADISGLLGVDRRIHSIQPQHRLPDLGRKFDVVTAIWIKYDTVSPARTATYWTTADWAFHLNDIIENQLNIPGRVHLILNEHRLPDGRYALNDTVLFWFTSQGATVDRKSGTVDITITEPRRFAPT